MPTSVPWCDRAVNRVAKPEVHRLGKCLPVDRFTERAPELVGLEPGTARIPAQRRRPEVEEQEVSVQSDPKVGETDATGLGAPPKGRIVLGAHLRLGKIDLASLQP